MNKIDELMSFLPTFWLKHSDSNNYKFFSSFSPSLEDFSTNVIGLKNSIQVSTATGDDLDEIGELFNLSRESDETDALFRIRILNYWSNYNRGGLVNNLVNILVSLLGIPTSDVTVVENEEQAIVTLQGNLGNLDTDIDLPSIDVLNEKINDAKAAGVYVNIFFSPLVLDSYSGEFSETYAPVLIEAAVGGFLPDVYEYDGGGELI